MGDADGKEITVHANPAQDHQFVQGHQFTNEEYEKLQGEDDVSFKDVQGRRYEHFDRHIGTLNCRHFTYSIIIGFYDTLHPRVKFGPHSKIGIFDTLVMKFQFACNGRWIESYDYKIRNRKDVFTHIDYKEQIEGELMFDAELDSICPGLSNYRISQYTDDECLDELKNFSK